MLNVNTLQLAQVVQNDTLRENREELDILVIKGANMLQLKRHIKSKHQGVISPSVKCEYAATIARNIKRHF